MLELNVCVGSACHLRGSLNVVQTFQQMIEENQLHGKIGLNGIHCINECQKTGVKVTLDSQIYLIQPEDARGFFKSTVMPLIQQDDGHSDFKMSARSHSGPRNTENAAAGSGK